VTNIVGAVCLSEKEVLESAKGLLYSPIDSSEVCKKEGVYFGVIIALLEDLVSNFQNVVSMNLRVFVPTLSGSPRILDLEEMDRFYRPEVK
jgi:hypothetical protein